MSNRTFNRAVVSEEIAVVYRGGGQRYFTLKAACRAAARKLLRDLIRAQGEDGLPDLMFQREVARMTAELLRGEAMTFDWDEAYERARDDGNPQTPASSVGGVG